MTGSPEHKKEILKKFWNQKGSIVWDYGVDNKRRERVYRYLEAITKNKISLKKIIELHNSVDIKIRIKGNRIIVEEKEDLEKFSKTINFSLDLVVNKNKIFRGFQKKKVLQWMIKSFEKTNRVYVESFGCPTNLADGEIIVGCLSKLGYKIVARIQDADYLIYNTCAVKEPTENRMIKTLKKAPIDKKIIVTGCLPLINFERLRNEIKYDCIMGPAPGPKIFEALYWSSLGEKTVLLKQSNEINLDLPRIPKNEAISIIPISYGCLGSCSYCCVRFARGRLRSRPINEIIGRIENDLVSGVKEMWFTSQDVACYGRDIKTDIANLLREVSIKNEKFYIRVGMMNPDHVMKILDRIVKAYESEKVFKFLHLPLQSGDDDVLRVMNRTYSVEDFKQIIHTFRKRIPHISIATDIICGFPCESDEDFQKSCRLIREIKPDVLNISRFFPRPGTAADKMEQLPGWKIKERSRKMTKIFKEICGEKNRKWVGWEGKIIIDEKGRDNSWIGRNFAYKPVVIKSDEKLLGEIREIQVKRSFSTYLEAEIF